MQNIVHTQIIKVGNSKGVRLPKDYLALLGTNQIILEQTSHGILIRPDSEVPPLKDWPALFAKADTSREPEFDEWDITLNDGNNEDV